jgi:hypothetical protein
MERNLPIFRRVFRVSLQFSASQRCCWGFAADGWIRGIVLFFRWKSGVWESKSLVEEAG